MATPTLKSPGPGFRALQLSDGSSIWMPPEATVEHWRTATQQGETALSQKYMAQAAAQNSPVTTKGMVYSATAARPNTIYGHLMGWIDHNLGGNALNANPTAQTVNSYAAPVVQSGARIATGAVDANPIVGGADLALTAANIAKHQAAKVVPALNNVPDAQTASGLLRDTFGVPSLSPNAPELQKIVEGTASTMANPRAALGPTFARTTGAETGQQDQRSLGWRRSRRLLRVAPGRVAGGGRQRGGADLQQDVRRHASARRRRRWRTHRHPAIGGHVDEPHRATHREGARVVPHPRRSDPERAEARQQLALGPSQQHRHRPLRQRSPRSLEDLDWAGSHLRRAAGRGQRLDRRQQSDERASRRHRPEPADQRPRRLSRP